MSNKIIIHKEGKEAVEIYVGFGQYETVKAPLCVGLRGLRQKKTYQTHRNWKYVNCKHCLKKAEIAERKYETNRVRFKTLPFCTCKEDDWDCKGYKELEGYCSLSQCKHLNEDGQCRNKELVSEARKIWRARNGRQ